MMKSNKVMKLDDDFVQMIVIPLQLDEMQCNITQL